MSGKDKTEKNFNLLPDEALITREDGQMITGDSKTGWYEGRKNGRIPEPVVLGERRRLYILGEVKAAARKMAKHGPVA